MKTTILAKVYIIILSLGTILSLYIPKNEVTANDAIVIPNEAIRLRILANSDTEADQTVKRHVRDAVNKEITKWVAELTSVEEARQLIRSRLPEIQKIAEQVIQREKVNQAVKVNFGKVEFPTKLYGEFLYPAGEYEAILITLGEGKGANWWCVLFPPLCFLDFSNSVAVKEGKDEKKEVQETKEKKVVELAKEEKADKKEKGEMKEKAEKKDPVYVDEEDKPVQVKFFVVELWEKLFG